MFLARDKHHLTDLCHLIRHDAPYIFQEYIKESHGRDVRVVLVGGRVIGSMLRCSTDGRMQSNCSLGSYHTCVKDLDKTDQLIDIRKLFRMLLHSLNACSLILLQIIYCIEVWAIFTDRIRNIYLSFIYIAMQRRENISGKRGRVDEGKIRF